jgi:ABC-2 type transport system permease protein
MDSSGSVAQRADRWAAGSWRSLRTGAWLGWQIESNWAEWHVFAIYAVLKPLAMTGIIVVMYAAINGGSFDSSLLTYMFLGTAFYNYVGAVTSGMGWTVVQDREVFKTQNNIYSAPVAVPFYLIGQGIARFFMASISVVIILAVGIGLVGIGVDLRQINWPLFVGALALGVGALTSIGLAVSGLMLLTGTASWALGDLLASALLVFSGAVFPIDVLPAWLQPIGLALPITYWLELIRRALMTTPYPTATLGAWSSLSLAGALCVLTAAITLVATAWFRWCEHRARRLGLLDRSTGY